MIKGIKFTSIPVRDQDVSLKFFTEKLGFHDATDQPFDGKQRWIELLIPGAETRLVLFTPDGYEDRIGGFQPISFWCNDVFATAKAMRDNGVNLSKSRGPSTGAPRPSSRTPMATSSSYRLANPWLSTPCLAKFSSCSPS